MRFICAAVRHIFEVQHCADGAKRNENGHTEISALKLYYTSIGGVSDKHRA